MHFSTVSLIPFALIFSLFSTSDALPSRRSVATFEPLFKRAAPQVGPSKAIERLRLRRKAINYSAERVKTARKARDLAAKRSPAVQPTPAALLAVLAGPTNPKKAIKAALAKRSNEVAAPTNPKLLAARSLASEVITNPKNNVLAKRQAVDESEYCDEEEPARAVATRWIPNPKAPSSTARATSTSSAMSSTRTTTAASSNATPMSPIQSVETGRWPSSGGMIASTYYADWEGDMLTPEDLDLSKFDLINFAFAIPTANLGVTFLQWNSESLLDRLVALARPRNVKVMISLGGWTGSNLFSNAVSTPSNMRTFVNNIVAMAVKHKVDGVDLDWEYPGTTGATSDYSVSDTANFLTFLEMLRAALPVGMKRLSSCVSHNAFIGANGSPIADVRAFSAVLDNIVIMNYDVWGASPNPGPNAPLSNDCPNSMQPNANQVSSVKTWTDAGMAASKILIGVPAYGYISSSSATTLVHKRDLNNRERATALHAESSKSVHRRWYESGTQKLATRKANAKRALALSKRQEIIFCPGDHSGKPCAGITGQDVKEIPWSPLGNGSAGGGGGGTTSGGVFIPGFGIGKLGNGDISSLFGNQIQWYQLLAYAVLVKSGDRFIGTNGYTRQWDRCSSTPYLYDTNRKVVITYDDPESLALKGQKAREQGIGGTIMWDIGGDSKDYVLTSAWRKGMGLSA